MKIKKTKNPESQFDFKKFAEFHNLTIELEDQLNGFLVAKILNAEIEFELSTRLNIGIGDTEEMAIKSLGLNLYGKTLIKKERRFFRRIRVPIK